MRVKGTREGRPDETGRSWRVWLIPAAVLAGLGALTFAVWRQQVNHQYSLLSRHTEDVAAQSSKRIETFLESHLRIAAIFARSWSRAASTPPSRAYFDDFAMAWVQELAAIDAVAVVPPDGSGGWEVPLQDETLGMLQGEARRRLLSEAQRLDGPAVSPPYPSRSGASGFYVALPMRHGASSLGYLLVHFRSDTLASDCFHSRIRAEFDFVLRDEDGVLLASRDEALLPADDSEHSAARRATAVVSFPVRNRTWRLTMVPKPETAAGVGWTADLSAPLLGLVLTVALTLLVAQLLVRVQMFRRARDQALMEIAKRQSFENALRDSESRYRGVFAAATDGLLVLSENGEVIQVNPAAGLICNRDPAQLLGHTLDELLAQECREPYRRFLQAVRDEEAGGLEAVIDYGNGGRADVEIRGSRLTHERETRLLIVLTDVSERTQAMERQALLSRKVLQAQEEERARLSRELHDELGQLLTAIRLDMGFFKKRADSDGSMDMAALQDAMTLVERATDESRRICRGLRPPLLDDFGLEAAIRHLVKDFEERSQIATEVSVVTPPAFQIPKEIALSTYRILQECLTNIGKHARATKARVLLREIGGELELDVGDDGVGFTASGRARLSGCGLEGMRERAKLVGGTVMVESRAGGGTRVVFRARLPSTPLKAIA